MPAKKMKPSEMFPPDVSRVGPNQDQKNIERHGHGLDRGKERIPGTNNMNRSGKYYDPDNSVFVNIMGTPQEHNRRVQATKDSIKSSGDAMQKKVGLKKKGK